MPTTEALQALDDASSLCAELAERDDVMHQRDALWHKAQRGGCTYREIAESCGVSEHTVHLRLARFRGSEWAQKP